MFVCFLFMPIGTVMTDRMPNKHKIDLIAFIRKQVLPISTYFRCEATASS